MCVCVCVCLVFMLPYVHWASGSVVWCLSILDFLSHFFFKYHCFILFSFFVVLHLCTFSYCHSVLKCFYYFWFFTFQLGSLYCTSSSLLILSLAMSSLLMSLLKAFFIFNTEFLIPSISFLFFFSVSIFVLFGFVFNFIFVYCLHFFISDLNIWNCNFKFLVWKFQHLYHIWVCVLMGFFFHPLFLCLLYDLLFLLYLFIRFFIYKFTNINIYL